MNTQLPPVVVRNHSALTTRDREVLTTVAGRTLRELAPQTDAPYICVLNGEPMLRATWDLELQDGDLVVFQMLPLGGGGGGSNPLRAILQIALLVVISLVATPLAASLLLSSGAVLGGFSTYLALTVGALGLVGSALINALVPLPKADAGSASVGGSSGSSTYSVALQGNAARLDQPIPVSYGRNIVYPDFAAQPYSQYEGNEQYYYAVFCIGHGEFDIEALKLDDTLLSNFTDVSTPVITLPGQTQSLVAENILNAPEVSGQDLTTGVPVGPFTACGLGRKVSVIYIDIVFPRGVYFANDSGGLGDITVTWKVEARKIDDYDIAIDDWNTIGNEVFTAATGTPQRRTYIYPVTSARWQVRVTRINPRDESNRAANDITWEAMRAQLNIPGITNTTTTRLALKLRASSQLSGLSSRRINLVCTRKIRSWSPSGGWTAIAPSRSIAWAAADVLSSPIYGEGRPDSRIDLMKLYELDQLYTARGDTFNGIFDSRTTVQDALQQVARTGRAVPIQQAGVVTLVRDGPQEIPVAMFNNRNIRKNTFNIEYLLRTEDTADGLDLEYWEERLWTWVTLDTLPAPGVTSPQNISKLRFFGVTNREQALREAKYIIAETAYRRMVATFSTEMTGLIPGFGDRIIVAHDLPGWASGGELTAWNPDTLMATLSEEAAFIPGKTHYILLHSADGTPVGPFEVIAGTNSFQVKFIDTPTITPYTGYDQDRTRYAFGPATGYGKSMKVRGMTPRGLDQVEMRCVVDDPRIHAADGFSGGLPPGGGGAPGTNRIAHVTGPNAPLYSNASPQQKAIGGWASGSSLTIGADPAYITGRT